MLRDGAQRLIGAILDCEKPVIAAVNGTAAGIGAHMAFACDLVVAVKSARFIEVFVRRGLVPDGGGAYLLTRLLGPQRTKELMFFGDIVTADEAEALGLVNRVVADRDLEAAVLEWAERLAVAPDSGDRTHQVAGQSLARVRSSRCVLRRGDRPGDEHGHTGRTRRRQELRRAAPGRVQRLVKRSSSPAPLLAPAPARRGNISANSDAYIGRAKWNPCAWSQPRAASSAA